MSQALSRTEVAVQRLGDAIDRLDAAAARVGAGDLLLSGELRDAKDEHAALEDTTRVVARRLDAAIGRLRNILEE